MPIELYPSVAKIKRNGVYENLPGFVPETGSVATQQMIATGESINVAQYVHNKGEYFRLNDTLYQAIVKINVGDSIVVGTNCEVAVIGNDLTHVANSIAAYELGIATSSHNTGDYFMVNETMYIATANIQVGDTISTSTNCRKAVVGDELSALQTALNTIEEAFETEINNITPSASISGKYISRSGTAETSQSCSYKTIPIDNTLVGTLLNISGSGWITVNPYIFVGLSGNISWPANTLSQSPTQYTDLPFTPNEQGTLYINIYASGSNVHYGKVTYNALTNNLDADSIPIDEIANSIKDATSYTLIDLGTLLVPKILNGTTGEITDGTNNIQRTTDYIAVTPDTYYLITTEANYSRGLYAFYDSNKVFIQESGENAASGSTYTHLYGKRVKSPKNAAYIVIGFIYQNPYPFPILMKGSMVSAVPSKRWTGKMWTIIGDSLSASYTPTGIHYHELIAGATGISLTNISVSGVGYAGGFITQSLAVNANSDVVTIFGSGNDASSGKSLGEPSDTGTDTIAGCINTVIDNIFSINPVMQLGIITPTPWKNNMPYDEGWMESYSELIVAICNRRSIPCLDLFHCTGLDTNDENVIEAAYSRDGGSATHLNEVGQNHIAPRILNFLESLLMH